MKSIGAKIYSVGTLRYNQQELAVLFFWLMWNDFSYSLIESIHNLTFFLMRGLGATFTQMSLLGLAAGFICPFINPIVSTWSDRHRGRYGRRRPFLFASAPIFAGILAITPFMPDLYHFLLRYPWMVVLSRHFPMPGELIFLGVSGLFLRLSNAVLQAIFSYLYWDVVPEPVMGRFQSLSRIVTLLAALLWNFWIFGLAEHHMKRVYVGTSFFCLVVYLVSVWKIKEGEYPPPDVHKKGGLIAPIRAYCVECFSEGYYLWIFVASLLFQIGNNLANGPTMAYLHEDLKLDLGTLGWVGAWSDSVTTGFGMLCGFAIGSVTDRLKGVRLIGPGYLILGLLSYLSFYFVHDKWTFLYCSIPPVLVNFALGIVVAAFTVEVFPREKLGQFCSAQVIFYQFPINMISPFAAMLFDHIHNNRLGFIWKGVFFILAGLVYFKVQLNWCKRHGEPPVPHAG